MTVPVVASDFTLDLTATRPGDVIGLYPSGAERYWYDLGDGAGAREWGDGPLPVMPTVPGSYTLTVMDALDNSRQASYPYRVVVPVTPPLGVTVSPLRLIGDTARFAAMGMVPTDQALGVADVPDGSGDIYTFHAAWPVDGSEPWGIFRVRGTAADPLAGGTRIVVIRADITGHPPAYRLPNLLYLGSVTVVRRDGKPDRLLMLGLATEYRPNDWWNVYSLGCWFFSDDYGLSWRWAGRAWKHAVMREAWWNNRWLPYIDLVNPSTSGPYSVYLNGTGTLLEAGEELWINRCAVNGPIYGPGGDPRNWCPVAWSMVRQVELCDGIDRGEDTRPYTRTWFNDGWNSPHDGPAQSMGRMDTNLMVFTSWSDWLNRYVTITQRGNTIYISLGEGNGPFNPSPPQVLFAYQVPGRLISSLGWLTAGSLKRTGNVFAVQTWRQPTEGDPDSDARLEAVTVDFA